MTPPVAAMLLFILGLCWTCSEIHDCPDNWLKHRSACYKINWAVHTWRNAEAACIVQGGHLLSVWDKAELAWLKSQRLRWQYWTGLYNDTNGWRWTDGSSYYREEWSKLQLHKEFNGPKCIALEDYTADLRVTHCQELMKFICKFTLDTCSCPPCYRPAPLVFPISSTVPSPSTSPLTSPTSTTSPTCPPCASTAPGHTTLPTPLTTAAMPKIILAPEICKISINQSTSCASNDYTCSCLLGVFPNSDGAFEAELNDGLSVNRSIVIRGQAETNAERLIVKLLLGKDNVTALQLNFHFGNKTIQLISPADDDNAQKIVNASQQHKFQPGLNFKIVIQCGSHYFNMTLDDNVRLSIDLLNLQRIKWLEVWHVLLSSIQLM